MTWSVQMGRIFGIPIRLHLTFLLLIGWFCLNAVLTGHSERLVVALALFASVLAHELGHCLVARRFQLRVQDITLLPIGGLARMDAASGKPRQEFWIAAAGPAVSFALGIAFHIAHLIVEPPMRGVAGLSDAKGLSEQLAALNLTLAVFNLLPAFPMDGGRILRAVLAERMPYARATMHAVAAGQLIAFGLGFVGLFLNPWLILIALFVYMGAGEEGARVQTQASVAGICAREATVTQFSLLQRADSLGRATDLLLASPQHEFLVVEGAEVVGILTRRRLLDGLAQSGRDAYVSESMEPAPTAVSPDTPLDVAMDLMASRGLSVVPVRSEAGLYGLLTMENLTELVMVRTALRRSDTRRSA